jgi:hypothetical protein
MNSTRPTLFNKITQVARKLTTQDWLVVIGLILLIALPRLTALNQYLIVDEADRWRWAKEFVLALSRGDLAGTRVGDGYPGIVPVWAESLWILLEAGRRSLLEGRWIGDAGLGFLLHEWERTAFLAQQRLPIALLNTGLALAIVGAVWRLFGKRAALVSGVLIALDPFYLSDSRVNRAEAMITGLMTLSVLSLIFFDQKRQWRYVVLSGILGGLSFLTKIQALAILPVVALAGLILYRSPQSHNQKNKPFILHPSSFIPSASLRAGLYPSSFILSFGLVWGAAAAATWFVLWPAMWVIPLDTLELVFRYTTRKVGAEGVSLYFMGQTFQDTDPGLFFYPWVLLMRLTPPAVLGLAGAVAALAANINRLKRRQFNTGYLILASYVLLYAAVMTAGSHKQDRYLMPVFPALNIMAGLGLVYLADQMAKGKWQTAIRNSQRFAAIRNASRQFAILLFAALLIIQLAVSLPHHPYYYSYFNPLLGGGRTAVRTLRVGWGEGMDQVGAYLAAKTNAESLVVSSRFAHNMLNFKGSLIALGPDGRWTQADYLVLYIQQVQRRLDPGPGFIDYFQRRPAEKVITIGGIDYAWIYPIPFTTPANPQVSVIPGQAALLGYSWEAENEAARQRMGESANSESANLPRAVHSQIRILWENQGLSDDVQLVAGLVSPNGQTDLAACEPDPAYAAQTYTPGAYVESVCAPTQANLPPGLYTVEFGLRAAPAGQITPFVFPEGWRAAQILADGRLVDTPEEDRLDALAAEAIPAAAQRLDRLYDGRLKLAGFLFDPPQPQPGQSVTLTLFWQRVQEITESIHLTVQLADSRALEVGRADQTLPVDRWLPGEIVANRHHFELAPNLDAPLGGHIEITLKNPAQVKLTPATRAGNRLDQAIARFTVAPEVWPAPPQGTPPQAVWQNGVALAGHTINWPPPEPGQPLPVTLFWQTGQPVNENLMVFVHLLDDRGQIVAQNDSLPRAGAYPTLWWQPGSVVEDTHPLELPPYLPPGEYQIVVGFYQAENEGRLLLTDSTNSLKVGGVSVQ